MMAAQEQLVAGDCRDVMEMLPDNSVDSIVTDPPYGLGFMGRDWDHAVPGVEFWRAALRVAKPGAHLVAFGGTRLYHRLTCAIEDAGWEIRDCLSWMYGSGFPKSLDVSKAIDRQLGCAREVAGRGEAVDRTALDFGGATGKAKNGLRADWVETEPNTDAARQWEGWGTALKPAWEPIILARKPLGQTVAANVLEHGTGAINVDACRVEIDPQADASQLRVMNRNKRDAEDGWGMSTVAGDAPQVVRPEGRWPANVVLDEEAAEQLDAQTGKTHSSGGGGNKAPGKNGVYGAFAGKEYGPLGYGDTGGASRFFYCAKAARSEREAGLDSFAPVRAPDGRERDIENPRLRTSPVRNHHPTVKPLSLMRWVSRLVTPPNGIILDPFMGSGSTGCAAVLEGFRFVGIDLDPEYVEIARGRIEHWRAQRAA